jgi:hypothetical protein
MKHASPWISLSAIALLVANSAPAQNPVPTRVRTETYGMASGTPKPVPLRIGLDASGDRPTMVLVSGGTQGELAALLLGIRPAEIPLTADAMLLVEPLGAMVGTFDAAGGFGVPVDIADPALIGQPQYWQGVQYVPPAGGKPALEVFQLSQGLHIEIVAGNPQPPLSYEGPPLTATPIHKLLDGAPSYEVLNSVVVPTSGWSFGVSILDNSNGMTSIYLVLEAPSPNEIVMPVVETKRVLVPFETPPDQEVRIYIEQRTRGVPSLPAFLLAAVIDNKY